MQFFRVWQFCDKQVNLKEFVMLSLSKHRSEPLNYEI